VSEQIVDFYREVRGAALAAGDVDRRQ